MDRASDARQELALGQLRLRQGLPYEAEQSFRAALELDPDFVDARRAYAHFLVGANRQAETVNLWQQLVASPNHEPDDHVGLVAALITAGQIPAARQAYEASVARGISTRALALVGERLAGLVEEKRQKGNGFLAAARKALADGKSRLAFEQYAESLACWPRAETHHEFALALWKDGAADFLVEAQFRSALTLEPARSETQLAYGQFLRANWQLAEARTQLTAAAQAADDALRLQAEQALAKLLLLLAPDDPLLGDLLAQGLAKPTAALRAQHALLLDNPADAVAILSAQPAAALTTTERLVLAKSLQKLGRPRAAASYLGPIVETDTAALVSCLLEVQLARQQGDPRTALRLARQVAELLPGLRSLKRDAKGPGGGDHESG